MNVSEKEAVPDRIVCPHLVEWTGWTELFCRLRYENPDILSSSEVKDYCKADNHSKCLFYLARFTGGSNS